MIDWAINDNENFWISNETNCKFIQVVKDKRYG